MKFFYLVPIIFFALPAFSQSGSVRGILMDTSLRQPVPDATITILNKQDSSLVTFTRAAKSGNFHVKYLAKGEYRVLITHVGYRNYSKHINITADHPDTDLGYIAMVSNATMLDSVTVVQEKAPVTIKNDTIEFNAGSFKTKPDAVVEDLLKKLPGVQVDKDGKIKANGEEVKKVLVDGKQFFGNDPKIASKNLPANVVDKVQVFDKKSEQAQFSGFDDGNSEKTINLTLKPDKKNGAFGKTVAAAGNKDRYQLDMNLNSFKGERQLSIIGMANNTNKQGFSFMDMMNFSGGLGGVGGGRGGTIQIESNGMPMQGVNGGKPGISTTAAGGINFNDKWSNKLDVQGSYFYANTRDDINQVSNRLYLVPGNAFTRSQNSNRINFNENHRLNVIADYAIDSFNSIRFSSSVNLQESSSAGNTVFNAVSTKGNLLYDGFNKTSNNGDGYGINSSILWRHRFLKKGRTLSATLSSVNNHSDRSGLLYSVNRFYEPGGNLSFADTLNQENQELNEGNTYGLNISYTEPLSKKSLFELSYQYNVNLNTASKNTYDADHFGKHTEWNRLLSNSFDNRYDLNRGGVNYRYQKGKINLTAGVALQQASLRSSFNFLATDSMVSQSYTNILPLVRLQYNINKYRNFRLSLNTYTIQPTATQLNPIVDNTDPLNLRIGNTELAPEYSKRVQLNYMAFDPFRQRSFFAMLNFTSKSNNIVQYDQISAQGIRLTKPVNVDGAYNADMNLSWGFPVKIIRSTTNVTTSVNNSRNINFLNGEKNIIRSWMASQEISLNFSYKELLDINAGMNISYNDVSYSLSPVGTQFWNQEYFMNVQLYLPGGFSIANDFVFSRYSGYADGFNSNIAMWNAGIAKRLFKNKKGEVRMQVIDLLNENASISRNTNLNYIEDVYTTVLNRYFLVSFTYNISRFAGKGAPVQGNNIKIMGPRGRMN